MGDFDNARAALRGSAPNPIAQSLGSEHPATAQSLHNLGLLLKDMHRLEEASPITCATCVDDDTASGPSASEHIASVQYALSVLADLARRRESLWRLLVSSKPEGTDGFGKPLDEALTAFVWSSSQTLLGQLELADGERRRGTSALRPFSRDSWHPRCGEHASARRELALDREGSLRKGRSGTSKPPVSAALQGGGCQPRNIFRRRVETLPERQALRYAATRKAGLDLAVSIALEQPDHVEIESIWDAQGALTCTRVGRDGLSPSSHRNGGQLRTEGPARDSRASHAEGCRPDHQGARRNSGGSLSPDGGRGQL